MEVVEHNEIQTQTQAKSGNKLTGAMHRAGGAVKNLFTKHRKLLILSTLFVLLCVTGYLNFALNSGRTVDTSASAGQVNVFTMFRNSRADERTRDIMVYQNLKDTSTNAATVAAAEAKLLEISENVAFETNAESLIMMENYDDVIVNRSNGFVNVILKRDSQIDRTQAIKIMSILQSIQPDLDIDNVYISIME